MNKKRILLFVVLIGVVSLWIHKSRQSADDHMTPTSDKKDQAAATHTSAEAHSHGYPASAPKSDADPFADLSEEQFEKAESITKNFDYQKEIKQIEDWKIQYPKSKQKLLGLITSEDLFSQYRVPVPAHTIYEMTQRQMGALKVLSLRVLLENENSKQILLKDLDYILNTAADTTLKDIARAAQESVVNGRPFVRDMIEGLSQLQE